MTVTVTLYDRDGNSFDVETADFRGRGWTDIVPAFGETDQRFAMSVLGAALNASAAFLANSTDSLTIGAGSKSLTVEKNKPFYPDLGARIQEDGNSSNYMIGTVTSYDPDTGALVVDVTDTGGSGTLSDWKVLAAGMTGADGAPGDVSVNEGGALVGNRGAINFVGDDFNVTDDSGSDQVTVATVPKHGLTLIASATAANDAAVDFTSGIDSTYDEYIIAMQNITPDTDDVSLAMRVSTDGGSTFDSGNNYSTNEQVGGGEIPNSQISQFALGGNVGSDTNETGVSGELHLVLPSRSAYTQIYCVGGRVTHTSGLPRSSVLHGLYESNTTVDAIRIFFGSGNIESGEFKLYGVRKS